MRDGSIQVTDARTGQVAASVEPGTNGFIRGTLRGLARERKRQGIGIEPPFMLTRWADGRLSLEDPTTGRRDRAGRLRADQRRRFRATPDSGRELTMALNWNR